MYNGRDGVVTDENGLLYMRARYYSPELKRFINADVIKGNITNNEVLNQYAYANGNPISNVDPFGLWSWEQTKKLAMGIGTVVSGTLQIAGGIALTGGTGGLATVVGAYGVVNGGFDVVAGAKQVWDACNNKVEDKHYIGDTNLIQFALEKGGEAIGGETGKNIGTGIYCTTNLLATGYGFKYSAQALAKVPSLDSIKLRYPGGLNSIYNSSLSTFEKGKQVHNLIKELGQVQSTLHKTIETGSNLYTFGWTAYSTISTANNIYNKNRK